MSPSLFYMADYQRFSIETLTYNHPNPKHRKVHRNQDDCYDTTYKSDHKRFYVGTQRFE